MPYTASLVDDTANTLTITGHPFTSNMAVRVGASTAPTGLTINNTTYYVIYVDVNTIYIHGIRDVGYYGIGPTRDLGSTHNNDQFILNVNLPFWSASTLSNLTTDAWVVDFANGFTNNNLRSNGLRVICVK